MDRHEMLERMRTGRGFIAALDQSGGSTPGALRRYGVPESAWTDEAGMFDLIHAMRTRIMTSPVFTSERILATILFEQTMDREIDGLGTAEYLWSVKHVVPFLKVDKGLADDAHGVRLMKPMPDLDALLERALAKGVFGTKMRSVVLHADATGIEEVVAQQVETARRILAAGLTPIVEPEVDIHSPDKTEAEEILQVTLLHHLDGLAEGEDVVLKLTLPEADGGHQPLVDHPRVLRVAALSGGYTREEAVARLARNPGVIASFSRALTEGLSADQDHAAFDAALDASIDAIAQASAT